MKKVVKFAFTTAAGLVMILSILLAYAIIVTYPLLPENADMRTLVAASESNISGDMYITLEQLPEYLPQAVIAIEDHRFKSHPGVDIIGILRAGYINITRGDLLQGASTITQQLARNLLLSQERTIDRKIKEIALALRLEKMFSKDEILEAYLNVIYLGPGTYGVEAAAHRYFGKSARDLQLNEAALLAGIIQNPTIHSPLNNEESARRRMQLVLQAMVEAGFITGSEKEQALDQPLSLNQTTYQALPTQSPLPEGLSLEMGQPFLILS